MIKMFRNCFLATKVSFCNEIYQFCNLKGVNYENVRRIAADDDRIIHSHTLVPGIDGKTGFQIRAYYSEDHVREIRAILASIHIGQPRKDGLITNNMTPTNQELTRRMGDGILTYTKTEDGRFIPVWSESI